MSGPTVIIDGHNTFIRSYVTVPTLSVNGYRVGGVVGMIKSIKKIINDFKASNVLVIWDGEGGSQRRKSIMSEYKAGRTVRLNREYDFGESAQDEMENMRWQRQLASDYLTLLGIPQVRTAGVEADDLMAYISTELNHEGGCIIVTTDQDLLQLIREKSTDLSEIKVYSPIKKIMYDKQKFISDYGVLPENFRFVKALTGDGSDNIDGIKGFGIKTIVKLFPEFATRILDKKDLFEAAEKLQKSVVVKRLLEEKIKFEENLTLVDLSSPMLSANAARQARVALFKDIGCNEIDFCVRLMKDGVSFSDNNLFQTFKDFVIRRRNLLSVNEIVAQINADNNELTTEDDK